MHAHSALQPNPKQTELYWISIRFQNLELDMVWDQGLVSLDERRCGAMIRNCFRFLPCSGCQLVLEVWGVGVGGEDLGSQQELTGRHGNSLQVGHHLGLVLLGLQEKIEGKQG